MSSGLHGVKGFFRQTKQATKEKFGKSSGAEECQEFKNAKMRNREIVVAYNGISSMMSGIHSGYSTIRSSTVNLQEFLKQLRDNVQGSELQGLIEKVLSINDGANAYLDVFLTKMKEMTVDPMEIFKKNVVHKFEKEDKNYKQVKLEHDDVRHSLKKAKGKTSTSQDKLDKIQKEYDTLHDKYIGLQLEFIGHTTFMLDSIKRNMALQLLSYYDQMTSYYGQVYRILNDAKEALDKTSESINGLPNPVLTVPKDFESCCPNTVAPISPSSSTPSTVISGSTGEKDSNKE